ncbi:MAG: DUF2461 domain-containing protein [Defluviitaleaceae bacterium]|nr:DUF2461 domain-containing protein [Defluviitaleaceae bacterium]
MAFSSAALDFLFENKLQNSKIWFSERKADYTRLVLKPLQELVIGLTPAMLEIDPLFITEPKVSRSISRIYRDTRFSKDKTIFRDVMWCVFIRDKKLYDGLPAYYFEISPAGFRYGMGYYQAGKASMDCFRNLIVSRDKNFVRAMKCYKEQAVFKIEGEDYKRSKYQDEPEDIREWLDKKSFHFTKSSDDFDLLFSDVLPDKLAHDFKLIQPIYSFLSKVETLK